MNIVSVAHSYPRTEGDIAGAFVERLNIALRARGHAMKVIVPSDRGAGKHIRQQGIAVSHVRYAPAPFETLAYTGEMRERAAGPLGTLALGSLAVAQAVEIAHLHGVTPVDVVHAHWWIPGGVSAWLAWLVRKPKTYVVTLHGTDVAALESSWIGRWMARRVLRSAAVVTAVSSFLADQAARFAGLDPSKIVVQPMPVDVDRFTRSSRGGGGAVTIGRLTEQKNVDVVLEAVAKLREAGRDTKLTVIGDGPRREMLERRAQGLGIADLTTFCGAVPPEEIPDVIGNADVMVFPAAREGLGLVAAEALLLGVPVVASQMGGGVKDIVPPTGAGRLVRPNDPVAIAQAMEGFLGNPAGLRLAQEAGQALRKRLEPDAVARVFESVYETAIRATGSRR